jgi:hypothetical protein
VFLQTGVLLLDRAPSLDELEGCLSNEEIGRRVEPSPEGPDWLSGDGSLIVATNSGTNGAIAVNVFARVWPDSMGSPEHDPELFGAWAMRHFGISTFPLALARAAAQATIGAEHAAFIRLNLSYVFGVGEDAPVCPADRRVAAELEAVAGLALRLSALPGVTAWFAPGGEVLLPIDAARALLARQAARELVPELWISTRSYPAGQMLVVETVGIGALGEKLSETLDHQLLLPDLGLDPDVVIRFLLELSGAARFGSEVVPAEPVLGPGGRWYPSRAKTDNPPPREVVRWAHESGAAHEPLVAELNDVEAERWAQHLGRHFESEPSVFHELLSDTIHLDVLVYGATAARPYHVLVTQGMSALPMTVPEGAEELCFAELMVVLPKPWIVEGEGAGDERWYWPMRALKSVARLPHLYETWIGPGHTIPNGDPAEPYAEGTKQSCVIVAPPVLFEDTLHYCDVAPDKRVWLYALVPLYDDETSFKLEHGAEAMFEKMNAKGLTELIDPERRSVLAKRFWLA